MPKRERRNEARERAAEGVTRLSCEHDSKRRTRVESGERMYG